MILASIDSLSQDVRFGLRQLRKSPGFTAVAVLSLGLGIGANTAIFQLVDAVRLRTLPVEKPEQLVTIQQARGSVLAGWSSTRSARLTYFQWDTIRKNQQAFTATPAWSAARFNLSRGGEARYAEGLYVSADFFSTLGVKPIAGRTFTSEDDSASCQEPGAVISHAFWQRELAADPNFQSRRITLDGRPFPIIGVTSPGFFGVEVGRNFDVAIPLCADALLAAEGRSRSTLRFAWWLSSIGRLKPGWTLAAANAQLRAISPIVMREALPTQYRPELAKRFLENKLSAEPAATGVSGLRSNYETPLWLLLATTGLVLLIACANLANLLLARATVREREIAVRLALGAGRAKLVRQLLTESLLLALFGTALGVALAQGLTRALVAFLTTEDSPIFLGLELDSHVLAFTAALAVATCLLFGLLPALRSAGVAPAGVMRATGRGLTSGKEKLSLRRFLVVAQVACSVVLLAGAILFIGSLRNLMTVDAGFRTEGVLSMSLDLRRAAIPKERRLTVYHDLAERLAQIPGVIRAAETEIVPISGSGWNGRVRPAKGGESTNSMFNRVGPGYFQVFGTAILAGRDFDTRDSLTAPKVAIVNELFAKQFLAEGNPLGQTFTVEGNSGQADPVYQVIGLVRNSKYYTVREEFRPIAYYPAAQADEPGLEPTYVLRIVGPSAAVLEQVKATVTQLHPNIGIESHALTAQLSESLLRDRLMALLSSAFGMLAALIAALGLYGVISYMVERRRSEIGIRMALGANRTSVIGLVLREAGLQLVIGLIIGAIAAVWAGQAAASLLYGLKPNDPLSLTAAISLLAAIALLACLIPARRAARLNPIEALRDE